jgi:two-component system, sensor histidine kinase and response regulator
MPETDDTWTMTAPDDGNVLVVDDDPASLDLLSEMLLDRGYQVRVATGGEQAISFARADPPEIIVLDVSLPDLSGYDVCAALKAEPVTRDVPVIFVSAHDEVIDKIRAFHSGAVDYIIKPFHAGEVLARLESQLKISRLQKELVESNVRLQELDQLKAGMTAMLVHDLRQPLTVVRIMLDMYGRYGKVPDSTLRAAESCVGQMMALVEEMLDLSRAEVREDGFGRECIDLATLLRRCADIASVGGKVQRVRVRATVPRGLPDVLGDEERLERVFTNLLSNAVKFTPPGGSVTLDAHAVSEADTPSVRITIADTGSGIPEEDVPFVFDPYWQGASRAALGGFGLGLAITKRIVAAHGGTISVRSRVGSGTTFVVSLPAA